MEKTNTKLDFILKNKYFLFITLIVVSTIVISLFEGLNEDGIVSYNVNVKNQNIQLYWKNDQGILINSLGNLKTYIESKKQKLIFATNAGMYKKDFSPQGLFIQNNKIITPIDTNQGTGNFYLQPNGVFYMTNENIPFINTTSNFKYTKNIKFATQSGPMLLINGQIHNAFKEGSTNLNIRNGVGILPNNQVVFAMSKQAINFYDFAKYFQNLGCKNALYLDGFVSRTYLPEKNWIQTDGNFGVMIGVTEK